MTEYQAHMALVATLEAEIVRLRAVNANLRKSLRATPQPARQPLTDKQIQDVWCSAKSEGNQHGPFWFAHAIERAHGIGGEE